MSDIFDALPDDARQKLRKREQPEWTEPMLATLTDDPFSDPGWIFERKLDGVRLLGFRQGSDVRLVTRNRKDRNAAYPDLCTTRTRGGKRESLVPDTPCTRPEHRERRCEPLG